MVMVNMSRAYSYYGIEVLYFQFIGFWQFLTEGVGRNRIVISSIAYGLLFAAFIIMQVFDMFVKDYDFSIFTEKLSVNLTCLESIIKMSFYCFKRTSLLELLDLFRMDLLLSSKHSPSISDKILTSNIRLVNGATKSFVIMIFTTVGIWNCLPLLKCYTPGGCSTLQIMPSWYPGDVSYVPTNIFVYIFEFFIMIYCAALLYNVNCIFSALALTASAQFELLSKNMASIESNAEKMVKADANLGLNGEIKKETMYILLRECLIDHQTLLRLLKQMEDVFNPIFLFQMLTSTFTICLVLFQLHFHLASGDDLPIAMACKFIMYLVFGSMELLVYSWGGQIIYNKIIGVSKYSRLIGYYKLPLPGDTVQQTKRSTSTSGYYQMDTILLFFLGYIIVFSRLRYRSFNGVLLGLDSVTGCAGFANFSLFFHRKTIRYKSEEIYWSLQKCGWHVGCDKFKTNVQIALQRSQFPVTLTAGKFYVVNLASFSQVIKASYSYFTFLHGSVSKE